MQMATRKIKAAIADSKRIEFRRNVWLALASPLVVGMVFKYISMRGFIRSIYFLNPRAH
jgi:hypothetical protein